MNPAHPGVLYSDGFGGYVTDLNVNWPGHDQRPVTAEDFQPLDEDPSRMYYCRELDGRWTLRSRFAIRMERDAFRWYLTPDGMFYAVHLQE